MQIFILDTNPKQSAQWLCDKHVVKQILESAQILTHVAHHFGSKTPPYKDFPKQYHKHPCTIWTKESKQNYLWLIEHALEICKEYTARYGKIHKTQSVIEWCKDNVPEKLLDIGQTPHAIAIKKHLYSHLIVPNDPVTTYRNYYVADKVSFAKWKRNKPFWWPYP